MHPDRPGAPGPQKEGATALSHTPTTEQGGQCPLKSESPDEDSTECPNRAKPLRKTQEHPPPNPTHPTLRDPWVSLTVTEDWLKAGLPLKEDPGPRKAVAIKPILQVRKQRTREAAPPT